MIDLLIWKCALYLCCIRIAVLYAFTGKSVNQMKLEVSNSFFSDPQFVKISSNDEDRILVYFNERKKTSTGENIIVPQVAQVIMTS